ncbi:mechanosensitive ion channel family protein [Thermoflexus sp.]|uniref:mechanosensitive ion channel family protein n=1 Tax=Thermoflexus sp. TaxID=1969742 RepID=UPI0025DDFACB|nr:mechanosensitive ion channel family protein [Thermoflexus sp.]MCS6963309.1 mechanosensitive ion channel family protein [Thermoflexus sp.]MCX7691611.1 mechanosensitive ion channel family protein [Thermoflexus sp.]MDW8183821.1 mechanosensitive ion channel family protein [Anaerolineae bacterium]
MEALWRALLILLLAGVLWWGIGYVLRFRWPGLDPDRARRIEAALSLIRSLLRALTGAVAILMLLSLFGLDLTPILTGAGLAGLVVGLAAQSLIRDLLAGLVIVLEGPFGIGDTIRTAGLIGTVERITMRATYLRDMDGTLHVIPNSMLGVVSNLSRDWARVSVDLPAPREMRVEQLEAALRSAARALQQDPEAAGDILDSPTITGIEGIGESTFTIRVEVLTRPKGRWTVARRLRYYLLRALQHPDGEEPANPEGG